MGLGFATGEACVTYGMRAGRRTKPGVPRRFSMVARMRPGPTESLNRSCPCYGCPGHLGLRPLTTPCHHVAAGSQSPVT